MNFRHSFVFGIALLALAATSVQAQLSLGGQPLSRNITVSSMVASQTMPSPDVAQLLAEDSVESLAGMPFRFGYAHDVNWSLESTGSWTSLTDGGRLWRLKISCPGAYSINLQYSRYQIPPGAQLFIYSGDGSMVRGAFTEQNIKEHGEFATAPTRGDVCVVEYYEPQSGLGQSEVVISRVVHGYKDIFSFDVAQRVTGYGQSGACNNNINCPEGAAWQDEKRSVAMILTSAGNRICTGTLVNNVRQDETPLFLTANHCLGSPSTWIFMFNYESPGCANQDGPLNYTLQGAALLANYLTSDFALLLLDEAPPDSYNVYYSGWNNLDTPAPRSTGIHHPNGDIKKISFDLQPVTEADYLSTSGTTHWRVGQWEDGTTEDGSSGSALFDHNHRIIGQLHGGFASCTNISADWYGKFSRSWTGGGTLATRLRDWLDPDNTGAIVLDGLDPSAGVYIDHTPLTDTRDTVGTYRVTCDIGSYYELVEDSLLLFYKINEAPDWTEQQLIPTGLNDGYFGDISAQTPGSDISYYLFARDQGGNTALTDIQSFVVIDYRMTVTPPADLDSSVIGDTLWFALEVTNTGIFQDSYDLTLGASGWDWGLWDTTGTTPISYLANMPADSTAAFLVSAVMPAVPYGDADTMVVTVASIADPGREVQAELVARSSGSLGAFPWLEIFVTDSVDGVNWIVDAGSQVTGNVLNVPSTPYAIHLDGGNDTLVSQKIDMSGHAGSQLTYLLQPGGNGAAPGPGAALYIDFRASLGQWVTLATHVGDSTAATTFAVHRVSLPTHAIHSRFQLRLRSVGECEGCDDWFVDDIRLDEPPQTSVVPMNIDEYLMVGESAQVEISVINDGSGALVYEVGSQLVSSPLPYGQQRDTGGPDNYGNFWIDSDEPSGPAFEWIDISGTGQNITASFDDDNVVGPLELGFDFRFYGSIYQDIFVGSNGLVGFSLADLDSRVNTPLPTAGTPNNVIAWLWDDMNINDDDNTTAQVYYDTTGDRAIIQFVDYPEYSADPGDVITLQVIIEADGLIKLQYLTIAPGFDIASSTVGIENALGTDGLEVIYQAPYLHDSLAIWIYQPRPWLTVDRLYGTASGGGSDQVGLSLDPTGLELGIYEATVTIHSNDPDSATAIATVPVTMEVSDVPPYVCGDIDGSGVGPDISDLVYLVAFMFQDGPPPPVMEAAMVDGNGVGPDISDLVHLVSYMFDDGPALQCP